MYLERRFHVHYDRPLVQTIGIREWIRDISRMCAAYLYLSTKYV